MSRIPPTVLHQIYERSNFQCELGDDCQWLTTSDAGYVMELHHRQARAMGGSKGRALDTAANLLRLHLICHQHVHAHPEWARERGYIVSQFAETP